MSAAPYILYGVVKVKVCSRVGGGAQFEAPKALRTRERDAV